MAGPDASWRTRNAGALLFAATDRCVGRKLAVLRAHGYPMVSAAQLALFLHLDGDGTRPSVLAARARLTRPSMAELVARAALSGLVERAADSSDQRARIVRVTPAGRGALEALQQGIQAAEHEVARAVGPDFLETMRGALAGYAAAALPTEATAPWRATSIGRLLALSARRFAGEVLAAARARGETRVTETLLTLFRALDLDGTRLTELARRARLTKSSVAELVDRAVALELVARRADPHDGRAKMIAFTADGLAMLERMRAGIVEAEADFGRESGAAFVAELKERLALYCTPAAPALAA